MVAAVARPVLVWLQSFVMIAVAVMVAVLLSMWFMVVIAFENWCRARMHRLRRQGLLKVIRWWCILVRSCEMKIV